MSGPLLVLDDVTKIYGRGSDAVTAVSDVSMDLAPGEIVAIVGQSGAGKSTLGRLVLGLERPTTGLVRFESQPISSMPRRQTYEIRRRMHLISQDPYQSLHPGMRVEQIVSEPLAINRVKTSEQDRRVDDALVEVGLTPASVFRRRHPHELSGGQRQRVAIARALVADPSIIVADEPTSMLDASLCAGILDLILGLRRDRGTSFLYITHTLAVARFVADRILVMREGRVVESGPAQEVIERPTHAYTRLLLAASEGDTEEMARWAEVTRRREIDSRDQNQDRHTDREETDVRP